jgi:L-asparaginase II
VDPITVAVERGGVVESRHRVHAVRVERDEVAESWGDPGLVTFMRSAAKPLQALPLARAYMSLSDEEVAIACASHGAAPEQLEAVKLLLARSWSSEDDLECGPVEGSRLRHNCSGKHAGMLALARLLDAPLARYLDPEHPAQRAIRACLVDVLELDATDLPVGIDGCSAPAYAVPLATMARGFALLGAPEHAPAGWQSGLRSIGDAMRRHPELVGGTSGRADTELMRVSARGLVAKGGAEGYFCVGHPDGLGLALKILDGDPSGRARSAAALSVAQRLGWLEPADLHGPLADYASGRPITNWSGRRTGEVRATSDMLRESAPA